MARPFWIWVFQGFSFPNSVLNALVFETLFRRRHAPGYSMRSKLQMINLHHRRPGPCPRAVDARGKSTTTQRELKGSLMWVGWFKRSGTPRRPGVLPVVVHGNQRAAGITNLQHWIG